MHRTTPICLAASLALFSAGASQAEFQFQLANLAQTELDTWTVDLQVQSSEPMSTISYFWFDAAVSGEPLELVADDWVTDAGMFALASDSDQSEVTTIGCASLLEDTPFEIDFSWQTMTSLSLVLPYPPAADSLLTIENLRVAFEPDLNNDGLANIADFILGFHFQSEWDTLGHEIDALEGSASLTIPAPATLALLAGGLGGFRRRRAG